MELWEVFREGQIDDAVRNAEVAKRDAAHADARVHNEVLRLEAKIDRLALICQALVEIIRDQGGVKEAEIEAKIREIDARDGRQDGKIAGYPTKCPSCHRPTHTRQRVCMYCSTPIQGGLIAEKQLTSPPKRTRGK